MAHTRISAYLPPDIDPTKAPIAFGRRALPKLNEELQSPELLTQQRALMVLCDLVHDPEKVYQAIEVGLLGSLKTLLPHHDSTVRQKTTEILYIMAMDNFGRQGLIQNGIISTLTELLDDPIDICRKNTHQILNIMAKLPQGELTTYLLLLMEFSNVCMMHNLSGLEGFQFKDGNRLRVWWLLYIPF
ncbi:PREDICTED: rhabdoid tumor deletion region protein 1-like [Pterocles gutturalis]|uniref:rhabdoid tumor deletion region protein 1-like n=1 Tax=Pterocles gutturalis TaxID=240206 RepID=UPI00052811D7|nr:PREDICTED: rhabdoid tumor deletion region protein 1-like [Pterocles gutturalis]